jgi:hypothetical protein
LKTAARPAPLRSDPMNNVTALQTASTRLADKMAIVRERLATKSDGVIKAPFRSLMRPRRAAKTGHSLKWPWNSP